MICCTLLLVLYGCGEDLDSIDANRDRGGTPVYFTAEWPDEDGAAGTRAIEDKREFKEGDVMHVSAVFQLIKGTLKEGEAASVTKYTALRYENGEWVNKLTDEKYDMDWPWNAVSATFTAYHMEEWNGAVTKPGTPLDPVVLDRFVYDKDHTMNPDPLRAESGVVEYGHAVNLKFNHLCTRLTITDVADEDEYELRFKPTPNGEHVLLNACTMTLDAENKLSFDFVEEDSKKISAQVETDEKGKRSVTFHLAPDDYSTFTLTRRNGKAYITLSNVKELKALTEGAGKAYTVSLENLKGNIVQDDTEGDWWNPNPTPPEVEYEDFSVKDFMQAIHDCTKDYACTLPDGTKKTLLKKDPYRKEMLLLEDVNFYWDEKYEPIELPDVVTFNGGGKTIWNISRSLFSTLFGTVTELNLQNAKLIHTGDPATGQDVAHDTGWGVLARVCNNGDISDVHLINATLNIVFHNDPNRDQVYCAGALVGNMISGTMQRITLVDNISVTVEAYHDNVRYTSCVGGVVGQANGILEDIDHEATTGQPVLYVTNNCKGTSTHYTGGIVGLLPGGRLDLCDIRTVVNAGEVKGTWNYTGGAVGAVRTGGVIARTSVAGSVRGGAVIVDNSETHSSTGGIVGHVQGASVTGGIAFNKVSISPDYEKPDDKTSYSIGGVIGSIKEAVDISKNEGRNKFDATQYTASHYYAGRFSGIGDETSLVQKENTSEGQGDFVGRGI